MADKIEHGTSEIPDVAADVRHGRKKQHIEQTQWHSSSKAGMPMDTHQPTSLSVLSPRGRVVIAEDNAEMREYLCIVLDAGGFEVDALEDGAAALAACKEQPPDVVVADVVMPGLGGLALIAHLRADELTAVIPVLLLSGHAEEESRIAGFAAGADDYLVKPIGARELVARVDGAIRLARLRQQIAQRQQADFESLFSAAFDGIIVFDNNGRVLTANERAQQLFGYTIKEFPGMQIETLMPPEAQQEVLAWHRNAYLLYPAARQTGPCREFQFRHRDESEFIAEIGLSSIHFRNRNCVVVNVRDITERIQAQLKLKTAMEQLQALSERLTMAQEEERHKIAFELHEQLGQEVSTLKLHLEMLASFPDKEAEAHRKNALIIVGLMLQRVRNMALDLRPPQLDDLGLFPALRTHCMQQAKAAGWVLHFDAPEGGKRPNSGIEIACFRVVQEALTNITRYAKATEVWLRLHKSGNELQLNLRDNGVGFDSSEPYEGRPTKSLGLMGMAERMRQVGGRLEINSSSHGGTEIIAIFPLENFDLNLMQ